jgi:hypothetical protein
MATRPGNPGLMPPAREFAEGILTYPHRMSDGSIRQVSIPVDWPRTLTYQGRLYAETGKLGYRIADRVQAAEYEANDLAVSSAGRHPVWLGHRVWFADDGTISPE